MFNKTHRVLHRATPYLCHRYTVPFSHTHAPTPAAPSRTIVVQHRGGIITMDLGRERTPRSIRAFGGVEQTTATAASAANVEDQVAAVRGLEWRCVVGLLRERRVHFSEARHGIFGYRVVDLADARPPA